MECPNCNYQHGWMWIEENGKSEYKKKIGSKGDFYFLSNDIKVEKITSNHLDNKNIRSVYGCPKCRILFIDE